MNFFALDVETANPNLASICQVGIVEFRDGTQTNSWDWLVDPEDYFSAMNVAIHGIDADQVKGQAKWPAIHNEISGILTDQIVVSHTSFDRTSLHRVSEKYRLGGINCKWLDSARVIRRTWTDLAHRGYGLSSVAKTLGIEFKHHNAMEDARAAGEILLHALSRSGIAIEDWLTLAHKPIAGGSRIERAGNPAGPLFGEVIAFTGALSISRRKAADLAAESGCRVGAGVTKKTTLLVVGDQDISKLAGHQKSSKHRKAEALIAKGSELRILGESDFRSLVSLD